MISQIALSQFFVYFISLALLSCLFDIRTVGIIVRLLAKP